MRGDEAEMRLAAAQADFPGDRAVAGFQAGGDKGDDAESPRGSLELSRIKAASSEFSRCGCIAILTSCAGEAQLQEITAT